MTQGLQIVEQAVQWQPVLRVSYGGEREVAISRTVPRVVGRGSNGEIAVVGWAASLTCLRCLDDVVHLPGSHIVKAPVPAVVVALLQVGEQGVETAAQQA